MIEIMLNTMLDVRMHKNSSASLLMMVTNSLIDFKNVMVGVVRDRKERQCRIHPRFNKYVQAISNSRHRPWSSPEDAAHSQDLTLVRDTAELSYILALYKR